MPDFELIQTARDFFRLKSEWDTLYHEATTESSVFMSYDWNRTWYETYVLSQNASEYKRPCILLAWEGSRLVALFPLVEKHKYGVRQIRWMGDPVSQYGDVLFGPLSSREKIRLSHQALDFLKENCPHDTIVLSGLPAASPFCQALEQKGGKSFQKQVSAIIDLTDYDNVNDFWRDKSPRSAKQRRRKRRKLQKEQGKVETRFTRFEDPDMPHLVKLATSMKARQLKEKGMYSTAFADGRIQDFFARIALLPTCRPLVSSLHCGDKIIAIECGFIAGDTYISHLGSYDTAFARYAPGRLQIEDTVQKLFQDDICKMDLLPPTMEYKESFTNSCARIVDYVLPHTLRGRLYSSAVLQGLRPFAKKLQQRLQTLR